MPGQKWANTHAARFRMDRSVIDAWPSAVMAGEDGPDDVPAVALVLLTTILGGSQSPSLICRSTSASQAAAIAV